MNLQTKINQRGGLGKEFYLLYRGAKNETLLPNNKSFINNIFLMKSLFAIPSKHLLTFEIIYFLIYLLHFV